MDDCKKAANGAELVRHPTPTTAAVYFVCVQANETGTNPPGSTTGSAAGK